MEARARLLAIESAILTMPTDMAKAVHKDLQPMLDRFNAAATAFNEAVDKLEALSKQVADHSELLEVLESDANASRVDVNAGREATTALAQQLEAVTSKFAAVGKALLDVGLES